MQQILEGITALFERYRSREVDSIEKLPESGSDRFYFRVRSGDETYIATYGMNIKENNTFLYFSDHFKGERCPVPSVYAVNNERTIYIQEDLGDVTLMKELETHGLVDSVKDLFKKSLRELALMQIRGDADLDYEKCITSHEFGSQAIMNDLLYFKYYFLDTLQIPYDKEQLLDDFEALSIYLARVDHKYFMFRDFQSRNIMVRNGKVYFIDYQGGMKGALQYDVASVIWQAKAELPDDWKNELLEYYMNQVEAILQQPLDRQRFISQYNGYVLIRMLQVMGAYGFRGLFERKAHFLTSIPLGLKNLGHFIKEKHLGIALPEFEKLLAIISTPDIIGRFENIKATPDTPLVVRIYSFSYKKGIPIDESGNGGGFVFDCRGMLNPGRFPEYKSVTGRDKSVVEFLEQRTKMSDYLKSVYSLVDISVEDYIRRGFDSLQVSFGCTGGQHRSVYAAEALARHLSNKFRVRTEVKHLEQEAKNWINE